MDLFDFIISDFVTGEEVDFFHFDVSFRQAMFPLFDLAFVDKLVGLAVSNVEGSFSCDLIAIGLSIPLVDESGVDLFEFGFGVDDFLCEIQS